MTKRQPAPENGDTWPRFTQVERDGRIYFNGKHVGWIDAEEVGPSLVAFALQWRARTAAGSSLGVFSTRAAAERAMLTQGERKND